MFDLNKAIQSGAQVWEKENAKRVYFNTTKELAAFFNYAIVDRVSGMVPDGFNGMFADNGKKDKSYYDLVNGVFCTGKGHIANAARAIDLKVKRI